MKAIRRALAIPFRALAHPFHALAHPFHALALLGLASTTGCAGLMRWPWGTTQRWSGPMEALSDPLPAGDAGLYPAGPEEVLVVRHADPVQVRPPGLTSSFPLSFYNKTLRMNSGGTVYSAPGGRIEVLWPSGNSITIFGRGVGIVGAASRGESGFLFRQVERALIDMHKEEQIELIGGAQLMAKSGPFVLDHSRPDILRIKNQSKEAGRIAFREVVFTLDPGQAIDLPLLSAGGKPVASGTDPVEVHGPGFDVRCAGEFETLERPGAIGIRAIGEQEIQGLGVRVRVGQHEEVWFESLGRRSDIAATMREIPPRAPVAPPAAPPEAPSTTPPTAEPADTPTGAKQGQERP